MMLCTLMTFAANIKSSYEGTLNVSVNGATTKSQQTVLARDNGNGTVTIVIPNFTYGPYTGAATINATRATDGTLSNPKISFSIITISSATMTNSSVTETSCEIHLNMAALGDTILVDFSGK